MGDRGARGEGRIRPDVGLRREDAKAGASVLMDVDVALVPGQAGAWEPRVCVMVDELRASSTLTTLLDLGCPGVLITAGLGAARRLARERGSLLAGERNGRTPRGFDANNSPTQLRDLGMAGHEVVLCTTNGTAVLSRLARMPTVLVGCLLNAHAVAEMALRLASRHHTGIGVVCAGQRGRFVLDDAVAAGLIVEHVVAIAGRQGLECRLSDAARAAVRLRSSHQDDLTALRESASGRQLAGLGADADVEFCSRADASASVPVLRPGEVLAIVALEDPSDGPAPSERQSPSDSSRQGPCGPLSAGSIGYRRSP